MKKWVYLGIDSQGNVRVGSTEHLYTRERVHRNNGIVLVDKIEVDSEYKEDMLKLERAQSRFYHMQSHEEEFSLINGDFKHSGCHYCKEEK